MYLSLNEYFLLSHQPNVLHSISLIELRNEQEILQSFVALKFKNSNELYTFVFEVN